MAGALMTDLTDDFDNESNETIGNILTAF